MVPSKSYCILKKLTQFLTEELESQEDIFLHQTHGVLGFIYDFIARVGGPDFVPVGAATWPVRSASGKSNEEN